MAPEIRVLLTLLTPRQRAVCALAWYDGMRYEDIGMRYGGADPEKAGHAVKMMVYRVRRRLAAAGITPPPSPMRSRRRMYAKQLSACPAAA